MHKADILLISQVITGQNPLHEFAIKTADFTKTVGYTNIYEAPTGILTCDHVATAGSNLTLLDPATPLATLDVTNNACILSNIDGTLYVNVGGAPGSDVIVYYYD